MVKNVKLFLKKNILKKIFAYSKKYCKFVFDKFKHSLNRIIAKISKKNHITVKCK